MYRPIIVFFVVLATFIQLAEGQEQKKDDEEPYNVIPLKGFENIKLTNKNYKLYLPLIRAKRQAKQQGATPNNKQQEEEPYNIIPIKGFENTKITSKNIRVFLPLIRA